MIARWNSTGSRNTIDSRPWSDTRNKPSTESSLRSLEASERLRRRHVRRAEGGARSREDRTEECDAPEQCEPRPRDDERSLALEEPQEQVVGEGDAERDAHCDPGQGDERQLEEERAEDHRFAEAEGTQGAGLLPPFDDVAHRDHAEARDPDDEAEGEVSLQQVEHAHRRLEDLVDEALDVQGDELVRQEVPLQIVAGLRHVDAVLDLEVEQARGLHADVRLHGGGGDPETLRELLIQDADHPNGPRRAGRIRVPEHIADGGGETPEVRAEVVRDDGSVEDRDVRV